jgi:hypothetical protein
VTKAQIAGLVRRIARTMETELDCGDCGKHIAVYVDAILAGEDELDPWALIRQHLEQCSPCAEEFAVLRDAAKMDLEDNWPSRDSLLDRAARRDLSV